MFRWNVLCILLLLCFTAATSAIQWPDNATAYAGICPMHRLQALELEYTYQAGNETRPLGCRSESQMLAVAATKAMPKTPKTITSIHAVEQSTGVMDVVAVGSDHHAYFSTANITYNQAPVWSDWVKLDIYVCNGDCVGDMDDDLYDDEL
eukprot:NODE_2148_length_640_cov_89.851852_g2098_i0.p1 GENE.NODE_2148_length_640_cov_89.851852_g2098_i0~~NODE_2148_length_640_cov_89.851852_g2098_i0.p1  ORF type:complete len:150 (-),score=19.46 NODE_2148_length_640_cov_89.851852_g2098_i0:134-583(-)